MSTTKNFFERAFDWIKAEFAAAETIEQKIAAFADAVINKVKTLQASETVQFLENGIVSLAESIDPALTPMISGIELELPKILNVATGITDEISKPVADQVADAVTKLQTIKGINGTAYAGLLGTANAMVQNYVTSNNGIVATAAQLLAAGQAVHGAISN